MTEGPARDAAETDTDGDEGASDRAATDSSADGDERAAERDPSGDAPGEQTATDARDHDAGAGTSTEGTGTGTSTEGTGAGAGEEAVEGDDAGAAGGGESTADGVTDDEVTDDESDGNSETGDTAGVDVPGPDLDGSPDPDLPADVQKYDRFKKIDGGTYDRANEFLRERTYITAREWAIARLCADFRTETGVEMTKIGENLPELVPFMTDTYTPQAVNQARASFEDKVRTAGATFLYGAMCDFFTAEELDDVMYEATEVAKFLLEVEGVELSVEEELEAEDRISEVMREVREHSAALRHDEIECPDCGHHFEATAAESVDDD